MILFAVTTILCLSTQSHAQLCGYSYRKAITINGSRIAGGPHANFPVLINHTDNDLRTVAGKVTSTNGYDIVFTNSAGSVLDFQLERYDGGTGQIVAWVKVPSITSGANVTLYMYYGNGSITTDQSTTNTWSSGYRGVWHFNNNVADQSGQGINSVNQNTASQTGKIGLARDFNGTSSWVELTNFPNLNTSFTISGWVYSTNVGQDGQRIFVDDVNNTNGYGFSLGDEAVAGRLRFYSRASNPVSLDASGFTLSNSTWYHVAAVADISGNVKRIYVNGVQRASGTYTNAWGTDTGNASIGGETASGETAHRFRGRLDEIRVASRALPADWIATEFNSQNQPTTTVGVTTAGDFYTVGNETSYNYGNPAAFGSNVWNVYAYSGNNFETYSGYYVHNTLSFDSRTVWAGGSSPSDAAGYVGCTVPVDNHSYRYKRRGFPCGVYQLDIPNHDDNVELIVNGVSVFQQASWYNNTPKTNQWQGYLDSNSEIEYTIREFGGDSHAGLTFVQLNSATQSVWRGASTNWFSSSNWCGSVPSATVGAYIGSGVSFYPIINGDGASVLDLTIGSGASLTLNDGHALDSYGDWTNNGTFTSNGNNSRVFFSGSNANQIAGTSVTTFRNVTLDNSNANALTLSTNMIVARAMTFTNGHIFTGANMVVFNDGASATGMSNASFVSGQVRKIGNDAFTFPIGKNGYYAPAGITAPSNTSDHFTAEYFYADPDNGGFNTNSRQAGINHVSQCEYWRIERTNGTSNENITLSWNTPRSCGVNVLSELRVALWNGTQWRNWGNGATSGDGTSGTVRSSSSNGFGIFTLASTTANNPLPVDLLSFTGMYRGDHILLNWKTASELNSDFFSVDKSPNGKDWQHVGKVKASGTTNLPREYSLKDNRPWNGTQYFRLTQTDFDGTRKVYPLISVSAQNLSEETTILLHPNPTDDLVQISIRTPSKGPFNLDIIDLQGNVLHSQVLTDNESQISLKTLASGSYLFILSTDREIFRSKIIRK